MSSKKQFKFQYICILVVFTVTYFISFVGDTVKRGAISWQCAINSEIVFVFISTLINILLWRYSDNIKNKTLTIITLGACIIEFGLYWAIIFGGETSSYYKIFVVMSTVIFFIMFLAESLAIWIMLRKPCKINSRVATQQKRGKNTHSSTYNNDVGYKNNRDDED